MSTTLILGDVHLGKGMSLGKTGVGSALNSRIVDQLNILEWTLLRAMEFGVSNLIITGDVFDEARPHPMIISLFIAWLKKCVDNDITVHVIAGNHDVLRSGKFYMSAFDIIAEADIEGVHTYKHVSTLHTVGASFTLMPFRDKRSFNTNSNSEALSMLQNKIPYEDIGIDKSHAKVVVGHLAIEGSIPVGDEIDDATNEIFCPVSMFSKYDYVWMGHIHKPQVMSKASPYVSHIGSMDLSDFGETDHKKMIVVFDPKKNQPYKYIDIPTRPLNQISVSVPEHITDSTSFVINSIKDSGQSLSKSIVKLNVLLTNASVINIDRLAVEKHLLDSGAFHIVRISEERKITTIKKSETPDGFDNTINERAAIKMFADSNVEGNIRDEVMALANMIVKECSEEKV